MSGARRARRLPPRVRRLLWVLGALLLLGYASRTQMYRVYLVNYRSNREIRELQTQLDKERTRAAELQWEKKRLQGPEASQLAALREGWGSTGQVRIEKKVAQPADSHHESTYRRLADRVRDGIVGGKPSVSPYP